MKVSEILEIKEAVRGVYTKSDGYTHRPTTQAERDQVAAGIKDARKYNKANAAYHRAPSDTPDEHEKETSNFKAKGTASSTVRVTRSGGNEDDVGKEVERAGDTRKGDSGKWQTRAVNTKRDLEGKNVGGQIRANQGKASALKKPEFSGFN